MLQVHELLQSARRPLLARSACARTGAVRVESTHTCGIARLSAPAAPLLPITGANTSPRAHSFTFGTQTQSLPTNCTWTATSVYFQLLSYLEVNSML